MSAVVIARKLGVPAPPDGAARNVLAVSLTSAAAMEPAVVTGLPDTEKIDGIDKPTVVTVPDAPPPPPVAVKTPLLSESPVPRLTETKPPDPLPPRRADNGTEDFWTAPPAVEEIALSAFSARVVSAPMAEVLAFAWAAVASGEPCVPGDVPGYASTHMLLGPTLDCAKAV
jgi:hypothetical protein